MLVWRLLMMLMDRYCLPEERFSNRWLLVPPRLLAAVPPFLSAEVSSRLKEPPQVLSSKRQLERMPRFWWGKSLENSPALKERKKKKAHHTCVVLMLEVNQHPRQRAPSSRLQSFKTTAVSATSTEKAKSCQMQHLKMPLNVSLCVAMGQYWRPLPTSTAHKKGHYIYCCWLIITVGHQSWGRHPKCFDLTLEMTGNILNFCYN